jgi:hypothetical protein
MYSSSFHIGKKIEIIPKRSGSTYAISTPSAWQTEALDPRHRRGAHREIGEHQTDDGREFEAVP